MNQTENAIPVTLEHADDSLTQQKEGKGGVWLPLSLSLQYTAFQTDSARVRESRTGSGRLWAWRRKDNETRTSDILRKPEETCLRMHSLGKRGGRSTRENSQKLPSTSQSVLWCAQRRGRPRLLKRKGNVRLWQRQTKSIWKEKRKPIFPPKRVRKKKFRDRHSRPAPPPLLPTSPARRRPSSPIFFSVLNSTQEPKERPRPLHW